MKRDKRTRALRASFTEKEWRVIEAAYKTLFPKEYPNIFAGERMLWPRQALLAVSLAITKTGRLPLRLAVELRTMTDSERELESRIEKTGDTSWIVPAKYANRIRFN
jgi:hypothetical protein